MPFRSLNTLEAWLDEFRSLGYAIAGPVRVMLQDGIDGDDAGLVGVRLATSPTTTTYIQPDGSGRWMVTLEPREDMVSLDAAGVMQLANELSTLSALCAFLQARSACPASADE